MESIATFGKYLARFHLVNSFSLDEILRMFYPKSENADLTGKLEFFLSLNPDDPLSLRFGLFKLHEPETIVSLFRHYGYDTLALESSLSTMDGFAPEYGVGVDWKERDPRFKVYFLRLQNNPRFNEEISNKIKQLFQSNGICSVDLSALGNACYLIGVDYHASDKKNMKIYTRTLYVDFQKITEKLNLLGLSSKYLEFFAELFSKDKLKDTTFSYKYSNQTSHLCGFSVFFEVEPKVNTETDKLVKACLPNRFSEFRDLVGSLEQEENVVRYSHLGVTFSPDPAKEALCLYYSPDYGGIAS